MATSRPFRITRNIEYSILDYLKEQLEKYNWNNVDVLFRNRRTPQTQLPYVAIKYSNTNHNWVQLGDNSSYRTFTIILDLYCESDGQREDLKDTIIDFIKHGFPVNQYEKYYAENTNAKIALSHPIGKAVLQSPPLEEEIDLNLSKDQLAPADRYRHRITINCFTGQVEK